MARGAATLLGVVLVTLIAWWAPHPAAAVSFGLADQKPEVFSDPRVRALRLERARLVVPWDAASSRPAAVERWLAAVDAAGLRPQVAFEHSAGEVCPGPPCTLPSVEQYAHAVRSFIARFPRVHDYTTWNEANHVSQPTANRPERTAAYYRVLDRACHGCAVVAGDVLDAGDYRSWLLRFLRASPTPPRRWGLHNYADVTYGRDLGTRTVLATVPGRLWLNETGGIVTIRDAAGRTTLRAGERQAARAVGRSLGLARSSPRITVAAFYQWRAFPGDRFDAGLVRPDGVARPGLGVLARGLAGRGTSTPR